MSENDRDDAETDRVVYGICPNGHGDEKGVIRAEESYDARPYPNCPVCGYRLEETHER